MLSKNTIRQKLLPWKIMITGDFFPSQQPYSYQVPIERNTLSLCMQKYCPQLELTVGNACSESGNPLTLTLHFKSIKDFSPDSLVNQVPVCAALMTVRSMLIDVSKTLLDYSKVEAYVKESSLLPSKIKSLFSIPREQRTSKGDTVPAEIPPAETKQAKTKATTIDSILDMVDTPKPSRTSNIPETSKTTQNFIHTIVTESNLHQGYKGSNKDFLELQKNIDEILSAQINAIIHEPAFVQLESLWRGLAFFLDRLDMKETITCEILACDTGSIQTAVEEHVFQPAWNQHGIAPHVLIMTHNMGNTPRDLQVGETLAQMAMSTHTLLLLFAGPRFFNTANFSELPQISIPITLNSTGYEKWRSLRKQPCSEWVLLTTNSLCSRNHYAHDSIPTRLFQFTEQYDTNSYPWIPASFVYGLAIGIAMCTFGTQSVYSIGRHCILEDLPLFVERGGDAKTIMNPKSRTTEVHLNSDHMYYLREEGIGAITARMNELSIRIPILVTSSTSNTSMITILLAGYISRFIMHQAQTMGVIESDELCKELTMCLKELFFSELASIWDEKCIVIQGKIDNNGKVTIELALHLPYKIYGQDIALEANFDL